jgi:hypothetical protein
MQMQDEPRMNVLPKVLVKMPYDPTIPGAKQQWLIRCKFNKGSEMIVPYMSHMYITLKKPFSVKTETDGSSENVAFYFDEKADADYILIERVNINLAVGLSPDDVVMSKAKKKCVSCVTRKVDDHDMVHCDRCGHYMGKLVRG